MARTWIVCLFCLLFASGWAEDEESLSLLGHELKRIIGVGNVARLEILKSATQSFLKLLFRDHASNLTFSMYTPENGVYQLQPFSQESTKEDLQNMYFSECRPTKIIIQSHAVGPNELKELVEGYFNNHNLSEVNIIVMNWSALGYGRLIASLLYSQDVGFEASRILGNLLVDEMDVQPDDIHIIGDGMGAHFAGILGRGLEKVGGAKIGRITAMNPFKPLIDLMQPINWISSEDAKVVDVIHTDSGWIWEGGASFRRKMGTIDFYVNGGSYQPGCNDCTSSSIKCCIENIAKSATFDAARCSHERALDFFIASLDIENNDNSYFESKPCSREMEPKEEDECNILHMGERLETDMVMSLTGQRDYCLSTCAEPPYTL